MRYSQAAALFVKKDFEFQVCMKSADKPTFHNNRDESIHKHNITGRTSATATIAAAAVLVLLPLLRVLYIPVFFRVLASSRQ